MMKIIFLLLISFKALALTDTHLQMKPNRPYMNYFLNGYLNWHQKEFGNKFYSLPGGEEFIRKAVKEIDHWKVPGKPQLDQILVGEDFSYRIYIAQALRQDPFIKKQKLPGEPTFMAWTDEGKVCFLIERKASEIKWEVVPKRDYETYLEHHCGGKVPFVTMTSRTLSVWKNPFHGQAPDEVRTYSEKGLESIFYFAKFTHTGIIPSKHYNYINKHGENVLLPFDKYSVDKFGNLVIFYP